jgi:citrate lyase beta subunit
MLTLTSGILGGCGVRSCVSDLLSGARLAGPARPKQRVQGLDGLAVETEDAAASGFAYKACIHPSQVETVRRGFAPSRDRIAWARRVVAACAEGGVVRVDGQMADAPLLAQAQRILAVARLENH